MSVTISGSTGVSLCDTNSVPTAAIQSQAATPAKLSQPLTAGTVQNTTSGTSVSFTSIPSWVKRITLLLVGVSLSGTSQPRIRIGTGGTPTTSGYTGITAAHVTGTTISSLASGFDVQSTFATATNTFTGRVQLTLQTGNVWVCDAALAVGSSVGWAEIIGTVTLAGTLDNVSLTTVNGTDTFDSGSVNILYE